MNLNVSAVVDDDATMRQLDSNLLTPLKTKLEQALKARRWLFRCTITPGHPQPTRVKPCRYKP